MTAKAKILLVEDEDDLARLFELALSREGLQIRRARDASAALDAFRRWSPALILLDVVLPGMSGLDLLEQLRAESGVPVILISGRRRPSDLAQGDRLGASAYLVKPFALEDLRSRVRHALAQAASPANGRAAPAAGKSSPARRRAARSVPR